MNAETIRKAHGQEMAIIEAAAIANQRGFGRRSGPDLHVTWRAGLCEITDLYAKWLQLHGPQVGVFMHVV